MVADALSRKTYGILASLALEDWKRSTTMADYNLQYHESDNVALVYNITATPSLLQHAKETRWQDVELREIWNKLQNGELIERWCMNHKGFVYHKGRLAIADSPDL